MRIFIGLWSSLALSIALALPAAAGAQPAAGGAGIFANNCAFCHGSGGKGTSLGPSLEFVNDARIVMATVRSGKGPMPAFEGRLTDDEIDSVAGFVAGSIAAVSLPEGDVSRGGSLYSRNCAGCHGATGRGGAMTDRPNAPDISGASPSTIAGAMRSGPGSMPHFPETYFSPEDVASIATYVQSLQDPPRPGGLSLAFRGPVTEAIALAGVIAALGLICMWIERRGRG